MGTYQEENKLYSREHGRAIEMGCRVYCPYCSHSVSFYYNPRVICSWCGRLVYSNNERGKKTQFEDNLKKEIIKLKMAERREILDEVKTR